jgi:hypothetical protein
MRRWLAAVVVASALGGCGNSASNDEVAVRHAVQRWLSAVVAHDNPAACAQLSPALRAAIDRHVVGEQAGGDCRSWAARWVSPRHPASHRGARIAAVRIAGGRATVRLAAPGLLDGDVRLVKDAGRWRIDDF